MGPSRTDMKRFLRLLIATIVISVGTPILASAQPVEELARNYIRFAFEAFFEGDHESAEGLLDRGFSFSQNLGDAWALRGYLLLEGNRIGSAADAMMGALERGNFEFFSEEEIQTEYLRIRHRLTDYRSVIEYCSALYPPEAVLLSNEQTFLLLDSITRAGLRGEYTDLFSQAVESYPQDLRFRILSDMDFLPPSLRLEEIVSLSSRIREHSFWALKRFIAGLSPGEVRRGWIEEYYRMAGPDDDEILAYYIEEIRDDTEAVSSLLAGLGVSYRPIEYDAVVAIIDALAGTAHEQVIRGYVEQNRLYRRDQNGDDYPDSYIHFDGGRLVSWHSDENQDGDYDVEIFFGEQVPDSCSIRRSDGIWIVSYAPYPYVAEIALQSSEGDSIGQSDRAYWRLPFFALPLPIVPPSVELPPGRPFEEWNFGSGLETSITNLFSRFIVVLPDSYYYAEEMTSNRRMIRTHDMPNTIVEGIDNDMNGIFERYRFEFIDSEITMDFFDPGEDGWWDFVRMHGEESVLYRSGPDDPGSYVSPDREAPAREFSPEHLELARRYQNFLQARGGFGE